MVGTLNKSWNNEGRHYWNWLLIANINFFRLLNFLFIFVSNFLWVLWFHPILTKMVQIRMMNSMSTLFSLVFRSVCKKELFLSLWVWYSDYGLNNCTCFPSSRVRPFIAQLHCISRKNQNDNEFTLLTHCAMKYPLINQALFKNANQYENNLSMKIQHARRSSALFTQKMVSRGRNDPFGKKLYNWTPSIHYLKPWTIQFGCLRGLSHLEVG